MNGAGEPGARESKTVRLDLAVCYCPIIPGDCWMVRKGGSDADGSDPQTVAECPDESRFMYQSGVAP